MSELRSQIVPTLIVWFIHSSLGVTSSEIAQLAELSTVIVDKRRNSGVKVNLKQESFGG
jgi:hypothetical protein